MVHLTPGGSGSFGTAEDTMIETDLYRSDQELAALFLAEHPEGSETFGGPWVKRLVYGVGGDCDPARYARICELARDLTDSVERQATFTLETVNGLRRVRGSWDMPRVLQLLTEVEPLIAQVPGDRGRRLQEMHAHHEGLVCREAGQFEKAAAAQERSAALAPNPGSAAISRFCAAVERAHHALTVGDALLMVSTLDQLRTARREFMAVDSSGNDALWRWQLADSRAHLLYIHWLAGVSYPEWDADMNAFLNDLPEGLDNIYKVWRHVFLAIHHNSPGWYDRALKSANDALVLDTDAASTAIAMLVLARVALKDGLLKGVAKAYLRGIVSLPGYGGHFVRAVAARELAALV